MSPFVCLYIYPPIRPCIHPSICPSIYLSIPSCPSIHLVRPSIHLSVCPSVRPSIRPSRSSVFSPRTHSSINMYTKGIYDDLHFNLAQQKVAVHLATPASSSFNGNQYPSSQILVVMYNTAMGCKSLVLLNGETSLHDRPTKLLFP